MTKPQEPLEKAHADVQQLSQQISANIARTDKATWEDVKIAQANMNALGAKMKTLAETQAETASLSIKAAITQMEAAGKMVQNKAISVIDNVKQANAMMQQGAVKAADSLNNAILTMRTKAAHFIEPKI